MSLTPDYWPPFSESELQLKKAEALKRELVWITDETLKSCRELKHGLDDCYALLAPIDPGSTLVMSTPRNERVKGTMTRVGSRLVKGSLNLQLRTAAPLAISVASPIHVGALDDLHTHLSQSIDLLSLTLARDPPHDPPSVASTLTLISDSLAESMALLKGPPLDRPDASWQTSSCPSHHFSPPPPENLSLHIGLQESCIVLILRTLEPVDAPVHLGTKLGLAIGTVRRIEHDEMDLVFRYNPFGDGTAEPKRGASRRGPNKAGGDGAYDVHVREKVRVESADPSLISLQSKLGYLNNMLCQTRRNLATVMAVANVDA
ncbi:hypothetical protein CDD80_6324 [Ophiocordyceps camponoti-rufipedis]|uniref:RAVE subunit 2/Rogdi n=1 Tax=Ophiocordyceps camponoti-rufipedis TaxID=2004952 RepID=A0A2C5YR41_9HYPO|nr:hypothetical protein CDD80_6324 [Ophiocordyceps camponoti-rufipedis]